MKFGVVVFPGSNCDADAFHVVADVLGCESRLLWHKDHDLEGSDVIIVPGGFSYGDYLRCGAIARFAPIMDEVSKHAARGGPVLGICNGFQVLTEAGLLPGVLQRNDSLQFICKTVELTTENNSTRFTKQLAPHERLRVPIAHAEGNYFLDDEGLKRLEGEGQVAFRYVDNPNGSRNDIAGVFNAAKNVMGMMPHPERASEALLGSTDGLKVFQSLLA